MRQPDFFVVGAAKSGTTALWKYFQQHPEIFVTNQIEYKELGYFSKQYGVSNKKFYLKHFKSATKEQLIGEVCHAYLTSDESPAWIKRDIPNAKIIILLRNPIDRAYSLYNWMVMNGYECSTTFENALEKEEKINTGNYDKSNLLHGFIYNYKYFHSGLYYNQVKRYYDIFGKENILIIEYEDFKAESELYLNRIFKFLSLSELSIELKNSVNISKKTIFPTLQFISKKSLLGKYGKYNKIRNLIKFIMGQNVINSKPKRMNKKTRQKLMNDYNKDIESLSNLTGFDFKSKWN